MTGAAVLADRLDEIGHPLAKRVRADLTQAEREIGRVSSCEMWSSRRKRANDSTRGASATRHHRTGLTDDTNPLGRRSDRLAGRFPCRSRPDHLELQHLTGH